MSLMISALMRPVPKSVRACLLAGLARLRRGDSREATPSLSRGTAGQRFFALRIVGLTPHEQGQSKENLPIRSRHRIH